MAAAVRPMAVSTKMTELRAARRTALVPFICAGDPSLKATAEALIALDEAGADVIEVGVPYSDPLADGPTIQAAATRALRGGTTLEKVISMLREVSPRISAPLVLFTYFNPIMARGLDRFCADIRDAGASGLLVPDIPLEETHSIRKAVNKCDMELVLLTTPTTETCLPSICTLILDERHSIAARIHIQTSGAGPERMMRIAQATQGFLYLVSVTGVTGAREDLSTNLQSLIASVKSETDKAVNVGFGVSTPDQAKLIQSWGADGVIVGSALVNLLGNGESEEAGIEAMKSLVVEMRKALG